MTSAQDTYRFGRPSTPGPKTSKLVGIMYTMSVVQPTLDNLLNQRKELEKHGKQSPSLDEAIAKYERMVVKLENCEFPERVAA